MPSIDTLLEQQARTRESQEVGSDDTRFMPRSDYIASKLDNKYKVQALSYPDDIMGSSEYGDHKVIFYINVATDSRVLKAPGGGAAVVEGVQRDVRSAISGTEYSAAAVGGGTGIIAGATAVVASGAAGLAGGNFDVKELLTTGFTAGTTAGVATYATGVAVLSNQESPPGEVKSPTFTNPQKRLEAAIALYIPNQLSVRYAANWSEEDTQGFAMAGALGSSLGTDIKKAIFERELSGKSIGIARDVISSIALDKGPLGQAMGISTGLASNPKKEQSFKNVDFRTFTFEYQFAPRTEKEAKNVLNIIKAFKYHMHPEFKDPSGFLFIYPSEFDIVYYKGSEENLNLHRHTSCVLTEMNVNYTPNGVFNTFSNGMPTQINLTLTFRELLALTKEVIERNA